MFKKIMNFNELDMAEKQLVLLKTQRTQEKFRKVIVALLVIQIIVLDLLGKIELCIIQDMFIILAAFFADLFVEEIKFSMLEKMQGEILDNINMLDKEDV